MLWTDNMQRLHRCMLQLSSSECERPSVLTNVPVQSNPRFATYCKRIPPLRTPASFIPTGSSNDHQVPSVKYLSPPLLCHKVFATLRLTLLHHPLDPPTPSLLDHLAPSPRTTSQHTLPTHRQTRKTQSPVHQPQMCCTFFPLPTTPSPPSPCVTASPPASCVSPTTSSRITSSLHAGPSSYPVRTTKAA